MSRDKLKPQRIETKGDPDEEVCRGCGKSEDLWTLAWVPRAVAAKLHADADEDECRNCETDYGVLPRAVQQDHNEWGDVGEPEPGHKPQVSP